MLAATESENVLIGDHADDVVGPRHAAAADHDCHGAPRRRIRRIASNTTSSLRAIVKSGRATAPT
jgi:hypothetical protein